MSDQSLPVIVNRKGGTAAAAGKSLEDKLHLAFEKAGAAIDLQLLEGGDIFDVVREKSSDGQRIVVAGGDGTMACAAQAMKDRKAELAILPLGTLNHLARDLGIPTDIEGAAKLAVHGQATSIDLGEVNDRSFVNNASIGIYPFMVRHREGQQDRRGWPKWLATLPAAWAALERLPHHRLRLDMGDGAHELVTPLLFVGNNSYGLAVGQVGKRGSLSDGKLTIYAVGRRNRASLIWFAARALVGFANRQSDFVAIGDGSQLVVHSGGESIEIALDGEVQRLSSPLHFRSLPGALQIVTPDES